MVRFQLVYTNLPYGTNTVLSSTDMTVPPDQLDCARQRRGSFARPVSVHRPAGDEISRKRFYRISSP